MLFVNSYGEPPGEAWWLPVRGLLKPMVLNCVTAWCETNAPIMTSLFDVASMETLDTKHPIPRSDEGNFKNTKTRAH